MSFQDEICRGLEPPQEPFQTRTLIGRVCTRSNALSLPVLIARAALPHNFVFPPSAQSDSPTDPLDPMNAGAPVPPRPAPTQLRLMTIASWPPSFPSRTGQ